MWGVAYKISSQNIDKVVKHLDYREKGGYERKSVFFYPSYSINDIGSYASNNCTFRLNLEKEKSLATLSENVPFYITIYIGGEDNPNYAGVEDTCIIARHILLSHGPSGSNREYLYKLASAMRVIAPGISDEHLYTLETTVKTLEQENNICIEAGESLCGNKNL